MSNEQVSKEVILKALQEMNLNINERFDKIDSEIGRCITVMEVKMDSIESLFASLRNYLEEQFNSVGKRLDLLEVQFNSIGKGLNLIQEKTTKCDTGINKHKKQMTAEEILEAIKNMENRERWKLLHEMYFLYYNKKGDEYVPFDEIDY